MPVTSRQRSVQEQIAGWLRRGEERGLGAVSPETISTPSSTGPGKGP